MVLRYDLWLTYSNIYFPNEFPRMGFPIKFEYHWDLFIPRFISPKADAKDIQINAKWKRQMWPQGWTQNQCADGLDQVPSKYRIKMRELNSWNIDSKERKFVYITALSVISIKGYKYSDERAPFTLVDFIWFSYACHILSDLRFLSMPNASNIQCSNHWIRKHFLAMEMRLLIYE